MVRYSGKDQYKDRKEKKAQEIQRALVHKARLKKNYLKLLKSEGQEVPEKERTRQDAINRGRDNHNEGRLTYHDRIKITKERKVEAKREAIERQQQKMKSIEEAHKKREERKAKFSKKTRTGQPAMGPRISDLLTKIKANEQ